MRTLLLETDFKGQLNSEWIYEDIVSPKMPTKNLKDFCSNKLPGQKSFLFEEMKKKHVIFKIPASAH